MLRFGLALVALFSASIAVCAQQAALPRFAIAVDEPVYTDHPLWLRAVAGPRWNIRYPFSRAVGYIGCSSLEVKRDGLLLLTPSPLPDVDANGGGPCGTVAPVGSPTNRLPLHVLYPLHVPGMYSVRWTTFSDDPGRPSSTPVAQSDWLTFEVLQSTPQQQKSWIEEMRAHPPEGTDQLAGDYLPSLLAVAPDTRALDVFVKYLYAENPVVSGIAASCLEYFPASTVLHAVADSLEKLGPSEQLAYFATQHNGWTREDEIKIVHATTPFLEPAPSGSGKQAAPYAPTQTSAALNLLRFIFYVPNHAWPANAESAAYANTHVLQAAPDIIVQANVNTLKELALYLGAMPPSSRAHELLLQIAERSDGAAEQARICLAWLHRAADLPLLASILTAPGDADASGRDRSSLPYSLVRAYGNDALPYLEHAVQSSSYVLVRTQSAKELALHNRPVGFQFLLNTIETNQLFKPEIIQWIKDHFSSAIPRDADDRQIADFLRTHATQ